MASHKNWQGLGEPRTHWRRREKKPSPSIDHGVPDHVLQERRVQRGTVPPEISRIGGARNSKLEIGCARLWVGCSSAFFQGSQKEAKGNRCFQENQKETKRKADNLGSQNAGIRFLRLRENQKHTKPLEVPPLQETACSSPSELRRFDRKMGGPGQVQKLGPATWQRDARCSGPILRNILVLLLKVGVKPDLDIFQHGCVEFPEETKRDGCHSFFRTAWKVNRKAPVLKEMASKAAAPDRQNISAHMLAAIVFFFAYVMQDL